MYQDGKVFRDIDFQIMIRKEKIKNHELSILKAYKLAGVNGPSGMDNLSMDYTRVRSNTPVAHIGLDDAAKMIDRDQAKIKILEYEIVELRNRKKNLIRILKSIDGLDEQIFYHRVIMCETQDDAADAIGVSKRHLQRIEKRMRETSKVFEVL